MTGTVARVSPRQRNDVPEPQRSRLVTISTRREQIDEEMRVAVLDALDAGGSVRRVAELAGLSPTTVQKWSTER